MPAVGAPCWSKGCRPAEFEAGVAAYSIAREPSFFFQAEAGIRDVAVTGVQTCALPISGGDQGGDAAPHCRAVAGEPGGLDPLVLSQPGLPGRRPGVPRKAPGPMAGTLTRALLDRKSVV